MPRRVPHTERRSLRYLWKACVQRTTRAYTSSFKELSRALSGKSLFNDQPRGVDLLCNTFFFFIFLLIRSVLPTLI